VSRFEYGAQLVKIATIEVRCGEYDQTPRITYGYRVYIHHHILHAAFDTMVEASVEAGRMNTKERTDG
jgi:hypothetical protein